MATLTEDIIIADSLDRTAELQEQGYITHALCCRGECGFLLGSEEHRLAEGDCLIIPQQSTLMRRIAPSDNFTVEVIMSSPPSLRWPHRRATTVCAAI